MDFVSLLATPPSPGDAQREFVFFHLIVREGIQPSAGRKSSLGGDLVVPRSGDGRCGNWALKRGWRMPMPLERWLGSPTGHSRLSSSRPPSRWVAPAPRRRTMEDGWAPADPPPRTA